MNEYKSMDYLEELVKNYGKDDTLSFLERIGYMLQDNGHGDSRDFLDILSEIVEDEL